LVKNEIKKENNKREKLIKSIESFCSLKGKFLLDKSFGLIYWNKDKCFVLKIKDFLEDIKLIKEIEDFCE